MNTQRRIFRGRGGPTDRRLPKHNARRRRPHHPQKPAVSNEYDETERPDDEAVELQPSNEHEKTNVGSDDESEMEEEPIIVANAQKDNDLISAPETATTPASTEKANPCAKEVRHFMKRVENVRETMSLSHSISSPKTYQENVLNAVVNCLNEWRSIATHYPMAPENDDDRVEEVFYLTKELQKKASLSAFEMIQQSVQCGPLSGSKPGYFKRCGGEVAKVVDHFLDQIIPVAPVLIDYMGFSVKQIDAMSTWKRNAQKAALEGKEPSRTALKHQQGKGTGKKAKKKMKG